MKTFDELAAENRWSADAELRKEFDGDKQAWLEYAKAEAEGRIRIQGGGK